MLDASGNLQSERDFSVLMAPMNFAMMPMTLTKALKRRGYRAKHIWYSNREETPFGFEADELVRLRDFQNRFDMQRQTLERVLEEDWDVFHFWNKSLFFSARYGEFTGLDLPILRSRGKRIVWRFTGADLRLASADMEMNPHSAYRYGLEHPFDEGEQRAFVDFLKSYVDAFVVPDAELALHMPEARIIPRALDLSEWRHVGFEPARKDKPVVLHAPSKGVVKGSRFVQKAIADLHDEGLSFEHVYLEGVPHAELKEHLARADIVIDQLHTGMGVATLEAWATGKAVMTNMRQEVFGDFYGGDLPAATANPDTVKDVLRALISDPDRRRELSEAGRRAAETRHDVETVVDEHLGLYRAALGRPETEAPRGSGDIAYLLGAAERQATERHELIKRTRGLDHRLEKLQAANQKIRSDVRRDAVEGMQAKLLGERGQNQERIQQLRTELAEARAALNSRDNAARILRTEREANAIRIQEYKRKLEDLAAQRRRLNERLHALRHGMRQERGPASDDPEDRIAFLELQVSDLQSELALRDEEFATLADDTERAEHLQTRLLREREAARRRIEKLEDRVQRIKLIEDRMRQERAVAREKHEALRLQLQRRRAPFFKFWKRF